MRPPRLPASRLVSAPPFWLALVLMLLLGLSVFLMTYPRPFARENRLAVERAVYRAVLDSEYTVPGDSGSRSVREIMLFDHFAGLGGPAEFDSLVAESALHWLRDGVPELQRTTIATLAQQLRDTSSIAAALLPRDVIDSSPNLSIGTRAPIHLIDASTLGRFFPPTPTNAPGWIGYRAAFPNATGILTISRIGLSPDTQWAIVYAGMQSDWLAGSGRLYVLHRRGTTWRIIATRMLWVS